MYIADMDVHSHVLGTCTIIWFFRKLMMQVERKQVSEKLLFIYSHPNVLSIKLQVMQTDHIKIHGVLIFKILQLVLLLYNHGQVFFIALWVGSRAGF